MVYEDAIRFLYGLSGRGMKLGLERIEQALERRGHPQRGLRAVHIAGSNGKGSVAAMVESCLRAAGHRTGLFTSPHLHRLVERVRVDGRPLSTGELSERVCDLEAAMHAPGFPDVSFFEAVTLLAFEAFRDAGCDVVVLEVGLGGRLDATNVVEPEVAVITRIAAEHQRVLGEGLDQIAREKAGILKPEVPLVCGVREARARAAIASRAEQLDCPVQYIDQDFGWQAAGDAIDVTAGGVEVSDVRVGLLGAHQRDNAACAAAAALALNVRGLPVSTGAVRAGLAEVRWPGRLERVAGDPPFLFDAAHNADGCEALAAFLRAEPPKRRALIFGAMSDKDHARMLGPLDDHVDTFIHVAPPVGRAAPVAELRTLRPGPAVDTVEQALDVARAAAGQGGEVLVAGSIFLVAAVRAAVLGIEQDLPVAM